MIYVWAIASVLHVNFLSPYLAMPEKKEVGLRADGHVVCC